MQIRTLNFLFEQEFVSVGPYVTVLSSSFKAFLSKVSDIVVIDVLRV